MRGVVDGADGGEPRRLRVRVTPNARSGGVLCLDEGQLRVRVQAPAVEGKANKAVLELLAKVGGCRRAEVQLVAGGAGRNKVVTLPEAAYQRLMEAALKPSCGDAP